MAEAAGVDLAWIWSGEGPMLLEDKEPERRAEDATEGDRLVVASDEVEFDLSGPLPPEMIKVPILNVEAALGRPIAPEDERVIDWAVCVRRKVPHPHDTYVVRAKGNSMYPTLQDGFLVAVDTNMDALRPLKQLHGKMVVVDLPVDAGGISIKWCHVSRKALMFFAEGEDTDYRPCALPIDQADRIKGRVIWWWGEM